MLPEQVIYLEPDDDITAIRDRLEWARARRVLLVAPRGVQALRSLVHLKVLARAADELAVDLAIATPELRVRDLAREAGLRTFSNETSARLSRWISRQARVARPADTSAPQVTAAADQPPPPRIRIQNRRLVLVVGKGRVGLLQQFGALLLQLVLGLFMVAGVLALIPRATVTLTPQTQQVEASVEVLADPSVELIDAQRRIIPARLVQAEVREFRTVQTLETEEAPAEFAQGQVVFINHTAEEQVVPISTTVSTSAGTTVDFITTLTATLPAGVGVTTPTTVTALNPGVVGNVAAAQINRINDPGLRLRVGVINEAPLTGGADRQVGVVTQADKDRLQAVMFQELQQIGYDEMLAEVGPGEFIPPESVEVIVLDMTYDRFAGDLSERLGGEMYAVVRGTVINSNAANQLAYLALQDKVPPGYELAQDSLQFKAGGASDVTNRAVTFSAIAQGTTIARFDQSRIAGQIRAMPVGEAQALLSERWPLEGVPGVDVEPNWLGRLPFFPFRINLVVREPEVRLASEGR
ncbi:MAG: baseplate J/gp47 family protein [Anaerolineae bacterium]